jgi:hypothetical protein
VTLVPPLIPSLPDRQCHTNPLKIPAAGTLGFVFSAIAVSDGIVVWANAVPSPLGHDACPQFPTDFTDETEGRATITRLALECVGDASALVERANGGDLSEETVVFVYLTGHATVGVGNVQIDGMIQRDEGEGAQKVVWISSVIRRESDD